MLKITLAKKEKILLAVFTPILALFLIERVIVMPFSDRIESMDIQISASEEKLERLAYMDSQKDNIRIIFDKIKPYVDIGKTEEAASSVVMNNIEQIAKQAEIVLLNMKPEGVELSGEKVYETRRVSLKIEGYQLNVIKFLYMLENSDYPLRIGKLDFKLKPGESGLMTVDLDVLFIYFV